MQKYKVKIIVATYGAIYGVDDDEPSILWLKRIKEKFKHVVWLNPIPSNEWDRAYGAWTIDRIKSIIHMEDFTLGGIKKAVEFLNKKV